jgi:hypothetical protein
MPGKKSVRSAVIPGMRCRNAKAAIKWLCDAFGFKEHLVVRGRGDVIHHAELALGDGMIMLGSFRDDDQHRYMKQPDELGGAVYRFAYQTFLTRFHISRPFLNALLINFRTTYLAR